VVGAQALLGNTPSYASLRVANLSRGSPIAPITEAREEGFAMSLSGALESFPVVEVLKLVGRTAKTGVLRIDAQGLEARLYLGDGMLTYGTTRRDEEFHAKLVEANMVDPKAWVDVERRERSISDILDHGATREQLNDFMVDQVSDVIFRVLRETSGRFAFSEDVAPRFETGVTLDVEACVAEAEARLERWKEIEKVIPGVGFHLRLNPEVVESGPVQVGQEEWRVLAGFAGTGSVEETSRRHGWSEFRAAELMAGMVRRGLLAVSDGRPNGRYSYGDEETRAEKADIEVIGPRIQDRDAGPSQEVENPADTEETGESLKSVLSDIAQPEEERLSALQRRRGLGAFVRDSEDS
jgi:hypothetical protein